MFIKRFLAIATFVAAGFFVAQPGEAHFYSAYAKPGAEIRIHPNSKSRVKEYAVPGQWLIFNYCKNGYCELTSRNAIWGWIHKKHLKSFKLCPINVCGDLGLTN